MVPSICKLLLLIVVAAACALCATPADTLDMSEKQKVWEYSVSCSYYALPTDDDILMVVGRADRGSLHLEARYNYEDLKTASAFAGWTLSTGESFTMELTPMAGVAFGRTTGIIPALEVSLGYGRFDFYIESEYLFDLKDNSGNFFYSWLELGVAPNDLIRTGLAAQRMRVFQSPLEVDRGVFAQLTPALGSVSLYAFNLFTESWFLVFGVEIAW
jgi:hypothetical protein